METRPESPQPQGDPRWVAMVYQPSSASWRVCAQSPHRSPVQYALGEMAHTVRARGGDPVISLWGPKDGGWHRYDTAAAPPVPTPKAAADAPEAPSTHTRRMDGRRRQVLLAGLTKAGLYDLAPDDLTAVEALVDSLDETTVRRVAHWLASASGADQAG
ncbi:hypothetical protein [Streptomyces cylindrosporus]|uniref:Uncharacterized protein n=1 Tax=Streptomyces cylindrosporus TaxID=2927583 RepID=A0ABS9YBY5_9ACTN|nr:hypothetical protein [Streptomyces cylindrosporus]MCI3274734.1 hypothetical protein [Streptomyces cylindrosporus]